MIAEVCCTSTSETSTKANFNITVNLVIIEMMTMHALLIICTKNMVVLKYKAL